MRWVQSNVGAFGGDRANVTLFGESAGAMSVCLHMTSPLATGLFRRGIGESGACAFFTTPLHDVPGSSEESAESLGRRFAAALGCDTAADVAACMRGKSVDELAAALPANNDIGTGARFQPIVDGYVIPAPPMSRFADGTAAHVDFLSGSNHDEATLFTLMAPVDTETAYRASLATLLPHHVDDAEALYPVSEYGTYNAAWSAFLTDAIFACPARAQARLQAAQVPHTYLYQFTRLNNFGRSVGLGVFHGSELPYVFGNFVAPFSSSNADTQVSDQVMGYWTRFATTGDPNGGGAPAWPAYAADAYQHLEIGDESRAGTGLRQRQCDALESYAVNP
jgi:para-nitrobenzyl esterase